MSQAQSKYEYQVLATKNEVPGVVSLDLAPVGRKIPEFPPGQYITVYFPELGTPEGKAYSISSAPGEDRFTITVRGIGEFSNRLVSMSIGDRVIAGEPYGYFYSESNETPLVMIAAGIGVAPFRSMIIENVRKNPNRKLFLFHSSRVLSDSI